MQSKIGVLTHKGKVHYHRKKHTLGVLDVIRMLEKLSVTLSREELAKNPYACNTLFEITRTAFYPTWQRAVAGRGPDLQETAFYVEIEAEMRAAWRQATYDVCEQIAEKLGIPGYIKDFVLNYMLGIVWDVVWRLTDPFFADR
jgi:hypothetical protein